MNLSAIDLNEDIRTSSHGLTHRIASNQRNEVLSYDDWVIKLLGKYVNIKPENILDIGCGVGKQTLLFEGLFPNANIISIDKSMDSLKTVEEKKTSQRVLTIESDIDDVDRYCKGHYDLIFSSYAIYYSSCLLSLLKKYKSFLEKNGTMMLLGYGKRSNNEIISLINSLENNNIHFYEDFLSSDDLEKLSNDYIIKQEVFHNKIVYANLDDFKQWFASSELSRQCDQEKVYASVSKAIETKGEFFLTKHTNAYIFYLK